MLKNTFLHLPGIGVGKEKKLWESGIFSWEDLQSNLNKIFKQKMIREISSGLKASFKAFEKRDLKYFYNNLPSTELWRLIPGNEDLVAFLDIETTGLEPPPLNKTTTISILMDGILYQAHESAGKIKLVKMMEEKAAIIVTYFGDVFDIPFLRSEFKFPLKKAQLDLCFLLRRQGYSGGLKTVETRFSDIPKRQSLDIDGYAATRLWRMHEKGEKTALSTLLAYNAEDTIVLQHLLLKAIQMEIVKYPKLEIKPSTFPPTPVIKEKVDSVLVKKLTNSMLFPFSN